MSTKEINDFIQSAEAKFAIFDSELGMVWQSNRLQLFYLLTEKCSIYTKAHTKANRFNQFVEILKAPMALMTAAYLLFIKNKDTKYAIYEHNRPFFSGKECFDIYTRDIYRRLNRANPSDVLVFDSPWLGGHPHDVRDNCVRMDIAFLLERSLTFFSRRSLSSEGRVLLDRIENEFFLKFGVKVDLQKFFLRATREFYIRYSVHSFIFKKMKLEKLYLVIGYGYGPVIYAAKINGVRIIELQHGIVSSMHMGYGYRHEKVIKELVPDVFWGWTGVYYPRCKLYGGACKIIASGDAPIDGAVQVRGDNKLVLPMPFTLVISQGVIGNQLLGLVSEKHNELFNGNVVVKLHPGEVGSYKSYANYEKCSALKNVLFFEDIDVRLLLAECSSVIGVFSTALLQAIEMEKPVYVLPLDGHEYMLDLIDGKNTKLMLQE